MTELLEQAIETVRRLPSAEQDYIARAIFALAENERDPPEDIDPAHLPDVLESLAEAERGKFATEAEVKAAFALFGE